MSTFCPTFEMSTKRNTSKTQVMTIQELFAKLSAPGQKRVSYGIYWAINKMNQCGTKSTWCNDDYHHIFTQWVSYKSAEFILGKLDGFTKEYRCYQSTCNIGGDMVTVNYITGMANGNVRIDVIVRDLEKMKQIAEEKANKTQEKIEEQKIRRKMEDLAGEMYGKNFTHEERKNYMIARLSTKEAEIAFKIIGY